MFSNRGSVELLRCVIFLSSLATGKVGYNALVQKCEIMMARIIICSVLFWRASKTVYLPYRPGFKNHERVGMKYYNAVYDYLKNTVLRYVSIVKKTYRKK